MSSDHDTTSHGKPPSFAIRDDDGDIDFFAFLQSLYLGALMALGEVESPESRRLETNLALARQNIDILVLLREKTRDNLTAQEDSLLAQVIPQLQILFAHKSGGT